MQNMSFCCDSSLDPCITPCTTPRTIPSTAPRTPPSALHLAPSPPPLPPCTSLPPIPSESINLSLFSSNLEGYEKLAFDYELLALNVERAVLECSNKKDDVTNLYEKFFLTNNENFYRIVTKNKKYPKTLLQVAIGNAAPQVVDMLTTYHPIMKDELFIESHNTQLLYNAVRGHKGAIKRIEMVMGDLFDINYTDNTNMNALKLAIIYKQKPQFISFLLNFKGIEKSLQCAEWKDSPYYYAIESIQLNMNNRFYIETLNYLVSAYLPTEFLAEYFKKKRLITVEKDEKLYCQLESKLLIDTIEDYFELCEHPMLMAKMYNKKLKDELEMYKKKTINEIIIVSCSGENVGVACCIHSDKEQIVSLCVYCGKKACPGHKVL